MGPKVEWLVLYYDGTDWDYDSLLSEKLAMDTAKDRARVYMGQPVEVYRLVRTVALPPPSEPVITEVEVE